jgi:hypothetical protein
MHRTWASHEDVARFSYSTSSLIRAVTPRRGRTAPGNAAELSRQASAYRCGGVEGGKLMKNFWRNNGLSLALFAFFVCFLAAQSYVGMLEENNELAAHSLPPTTYAAYLQSGAFLEATMENWESEFLQMSVYVLFTVFLFQRGSAESKPIDKDDPVDRDPQASKLKPDAPWPVRKGGWILQLYEYSLSLAFLLLFLFSFAFHAIGGARAYSEEQIAHGEPPVTVFEYLANSRFWFESFQNWQSEFLAIWAMVVLSIFLRQRGSPESKPVDAPHSQTGSE